ncbi:hypothetical protein ACNKHR_16270 [Shigella flexneri]
MNSQLIELIHKSGDGDFVSSKNNQKIIRKNCLPPCSPTFIRLNNRDSKGGKDPQEAIRLVIDESHFAAVHFTATDYEPLQQLRIKRASELSAEQVFIQYSKRI